MTPEQKARVSIDTLLQQAGWHVCDMAKARGEGGVRGNLFAKPEPTLRKAFEAQ